MPTFEEILAAARARGEAEGRTPQPVNHAPSPAPPPAPSTEPVVYTCTGCHRTTTARGRLAAAPPEKFVGYCRNCQTRREYVRKHAGAPAPAGGPPAPDLVAIAAQAIKAAFAGPIPTNPPAGPALPLPAIPSNTKPGAELYVCRECRDLRWFTDHDDAGYITRTCPVCKAAGRGRSKGRNKGLTAWTRIRTVPEYQKNEPAGSMRPIPGGMRGMWEPIPPGDHAAMNAEVARRIKAYGP